MNPIVQELRETGVTMLEAMTYTEAMILRAFLLSRAVYQNAHVPQTARNRGADQTVDRWKAKASEYICVSTADAILSPYILERAMATIDIAAEYLGRDPPVGYSMNAFWTRPGPTMRADLQDFHVDADDPQGFLAMFVYLSDVLTDQDGPHDIKGPDGEIRTIRGFTGTIFLANTALPHRGRKPISGERGIAWFRWGKSDRPPANVWDGIQPIDRAWLGSRYPADLRLREAIKLLAA